MSAPTVFYAWQNDRPRANNRDHIHAAASEAVRRTGQGMRVEDSPRLDHDTLNESGTPAISETIFQKIKYSAVLVADVTFCADVRDDAGEIKKRLPNPNVMIELGFAAAIMGWQRIILVMNKHYGSPEWLPFDLKNHRFPITYELGPNSKKGPQILGELVEDIEKAVLDCLMAEYDLVNTTLSRLASYSRYLMKEYGLHGAFWETERTNMVLSRLDLAVSQMLELNVIRCVDVGTGEQECRYEWTYLGRQCCQRLGAKFPPLTAIAPPHGAPDHVVVRSYLDEVLDEGKKKQE